MQPINPVELGKFANIVKEFIAEVKPLTIDDEDVGATISAIELAIFCGKTDTICIDFATEARPYICKIMSGDEEFFLKSDLKFEKNNNLIDPIRKLWVGIDPVKQKLIKLFMKRLVVSCYVYCLRDVAAVAELNTLVGKDLKKPYVL